MKPLKLLTKEQNEKLYHLKDVARAQSYLVGLEFRTGTPASYERENAKLIKLQTSIIMLTAVNFIDIVQKDQNQDPELLKNREQAYQEYKKEKDSLTAEFERNYWIQQEKWRVEREESIAREKLNV